MSFFSTISTKAVAAWEYCSSGVLTDTRKKWWVSVVRTLNITVNSFLDTDLQSRACALTYRTMLAIVPALALLLAIGRGFGLQEILQNELMQMFPAQQEAIMKALTFVDSYLNQASEGVFVGIGILFLLWTLISLVSSIEDSFNTIWNVKTSRTVWRQITDYTAMFLILPVLMICASGLSIMVSSTMQRLLDIEFLTPILSFLFEAASVVFTWLFFTAVFMLIPNTKVKFRYAFISGILSGTVFMILQWLFVTGQLYVAKYNAIYGSFSFLPLLLIWMQLAWVTTLVGSLICYASQNVFKLSFAVEINNIAPGYLQEVTIAVATVIVKRFASSASPITKKEIATSYNIPSRLLDDILDRLRRAKLISLVLLEGSKNRYGFQPAIPLDKFSVAELYNRLQNLGYSGFVPDFVKNFSGVSAVYRQAAGDINAEEGKILLRDLEIKTPS